MINIPRVVVLALILSGIAEAQSGPQAPELRGLGSMHMAVSTDVAKAQAFFDQGLRLLYAFNHEEARRAFLEAARLDSQLAMAHWGVALTYAPNLNAPMSPEHGRAALAAIGQARRLAVGVSTREQALIEALARRFAEDPSAPRPPLDRAYADAMKGVSAAHPEDPDVATLYVDAVMNTMPWDYWQKDGSPKPETGVVGEVLERVIRANPDHAGAHHYYIHLYEASDTPERAEASADRLGALSPAAGHMVHMPAHIYIRVGRYADAAEANVRAVAADEDYLAQCQRQGLYPVSYYPHNLHFLWAAATLEGRGAVAIEAARQVAAKVPHHHAGALAWTADFPVTPMLAYVRFGKWQEMLTEPAPPANEPFAFGIWHYGRALAFIARGQTTRAEAELARLTTLLDHEAFKMRFKDLALLPNLQIAQRIVRGELAARAQRLDEAIKIVEEAVAIEDAFPYSEPPIWHQPTRQVLGAVLLQAGRAVEAEAAYRADLKRFPENGWSLFGLWESLRAQGREGDAQLVRARFDKAWARADVTLTSSRILEAKERAVVKSISLPTGVTLQYAERGHASGVPVIFLHGVTDSWRSFEPMFEHLPQNIRALAISQRGHGQSGKPSHGYTYTDMSEDLRAFMDGLDLPAAVIVGHSMGSLVAQRFAVDHPGRVAGLVLMGAPKTLHRHAGIQEMWDSTLSTMGDPIDPAFVRDFQVSTLAREVPAEFLDLVVHESLKVPARVWRAAFRAFLDTPDFSGQLARVTAPALIAWGDRDTYALLADQESLVAALPRARRVTYQGAGHAFHWEDPARFAADLVAFVYERR